MLEFDNVNYTFMHLLDLDLYALNLHLVLSLFGQLLRNLWSSGHNRYYTL